MSPHQASKQYFLVTTICIVYCILVFVAWQFIANPIVFIAVAIIPIGMIIVLQQPFLFVLLFVIFSFFRIHEAFPALLNLKIPLLLSAASLFALFWHVGFTRQIKLYWRDEFTLLAQFYLLVAIGVIFASNRPVAMLYFKTVYWKIMLMSFAIAWLSRSKKDFALASRLITFFGLLVGLVALYNQHNGIGLVEGSRVTISRDIGSLLGDPNDLALVLMFPVAFAISLVSTPKIDKKTKLLGLLAVLVLIGAILATQSRGGLLGIMAIFAVFCYRRMKSKSLFFFLCISCSSILFVAAGISDRSSGGSAESGVDESAMGRIYAWQAAWGMALHNPLTGVGVNNFFYNYFYYSPHWDGLNHAVHSTWFGVLAETGYLGFIVFVRCIFSLVRTAMRSLNSIEANIENVAPDIHATAQAVFAGLIGTIVSATFLTQGFTWPIYILAAFVLAIAQYNDQHLKTKVESK
ncbi:MAG: oligosaccharide repeat unit polymerase [Psychromonas sp.]|nr:oligosaccharide repeat unit polymerase [Alteromonadales bacterium]MCP5079819.1 oligosaccharide repeat unit polymerase [Psychromonas sp.]